ncbi:serine/threonine protein kinase [Microbacterium aurum]|uniref:non-specific serine/threonine protein kinase n=1 Tax=Microbacterium aurum TaxID=36805 RepID=A0A1P8UBJ8_9MICO|nr:serine/threonine-protein kinase [Microbacterium aurum]APZ35472.1 serine/threonine protein kinase [Microbacterium aurum]MBM7826154.1 serine/threonine protein kinase [Microbacterium aurum]
MSAAKRPPAPPPALAGFTYLDVLGSGGFADVYLYEQHLPRRRVAVKVMLEGRMAGGAAEQFAAEANVMALLSTHPAIVTIYQAGVSDDGRPYLVMEYCPRPNLQVRSRAAAFSVAEALRVGVQVAAAVETAHRAGILHRDIKPANILVTEYNRPALTDFGIATTADAVESSAGMSIPWSPPESFTDQPESGVATDVYALGATVYTLLAGRSPFEQPGGRNGGADLIQRIESQPVPRLERADAPASLQAVLERAMAKRPGDRFESAVAFARALQRVQIELAHSVTPIDILDDAPDEDTQDPDVDGELTRVRGIVSIEPQTGPAAGPTRRRDHPDAHAAATASWAPPVTDAGDTADPTVLRGPVSIVPEATVADTGFAPTSAATDAVDTATVRRRPMETPQAPATPAAPGGPAAGGAGAPGAPTVPPAHGGDAAGGSAGGGPAGGPAAPRSRRGLWIGAGIAAAVVVVGGIALGASLIAPAVQEPVESPPASVAPQDPIGDVVPAVADLTGSVQGADAVFTWTNPDPQEGDAYLWHVVTLTGNGQDERVEATTVTLPADPGGTTCIEVTLLRSTGRAGPVTRECTS